MAVGTRVVMTALAGASALVTMSAALAAESEESLAGWTPPQVVYLMGASDLEKLKHANPAHYARAERILAASDEICKPGRDQVYFARFDAQGISCQSMLIKTSNPPKRQLAFTLDHTRYIALVVLQDAEAQFQRVPAVVSPPAQAGK